jgi:hypothetical protein
MKGQRVGSVAGPFFVHHSPDHLRNPSKEFASLDSLDERLLSNLSPFGLVAHHERTVEISIPSPRYTRS